MTESQVRTIPAHWAEITQGSCDGVEVVITAWKPSPDELAELNRGGLVYFSCIGGLPPHFLTTDFQTARSVA